MHAIAAARAAGWLGDDIDRHGFSFDIEIRRGAGAYICGEETAIFNSIEGYRGEPRNKPPYPTDVGLFGLPTVVNNVETLVNVLPILEHGARCVRRDRHRGFDRNQVVLRVGLCGATRASTRSSSVHRCANLLEMAGGVRGGRPLQCVLLGGAAGMFVRADEIDLALDVRRHACRVGVARVGGRARARRHGRPRGVPASHRLVLPGRVVRSMRAVPYRCGAPGRSCSNDWPAGNPRESVDAELTLLSDIARAMRDASICGLGQTASSAIESAMVKFQPFRRS